MSNLNLVYDTSSGNKLVKLQIHKNEVDFIVLKTLVNDCPPQLVPVSYYELNDSIVVEYDCFNLLDFKYLPHLFKQEEYLTILGKIIEFSEQCSDWFLSNSLLNYDTDYIFYSKEDLLIKLIYIPLKQSNSKLPSLKQLVTQLVKNYKVENGEKLQYELLKVVIEPGFIIADIKNIIKNYYKEKSTNILAETPIATGLDTSDLAPIEKDIEEINTVEPNQQLPLVHTDNIFEMLKNSKESSAQIKELKKAKPKKVAKKGFFRELFKSNRSKKHKKKEELRGEVNFEEIKINGFKNSIVDTEQFENINSKTVILNQNKQCKYYLKLVDSNSHYNAPFEININTDTAFTIGREDYQRGSSCSFEFNSDMKSVSRIHARIDYANHSLSIVDLQSANGTFVNNKKLMANIPQQIKENDLVKFSTKIIYMLCARE